MDFLFLCSKDKDNIFKNERQTMKNDMVLIIDFGSQVTQLIARRLRELNVYCEIHPFQNINDILNYNISPKAIILSGGPASVIDDNSPRPPKIILRWEFLY